MAFTSATCGKRKKKIYNTPFGTYLYRDIPVSVFPLGINIIEEGEYSYQIAIPEKALCDKLYTLNVIKNMTELEYVLFDDLRIDKIEFNKLNIEFVREISQFYHSTNVNLLYKYMRKKIQ